MIFPVLRRMVFTLAMEENGYCGADRGHGCSQARKDKCGGPQMEPVCPPVKRHTCLGTEDTDDCCSPEKSAYSGIKQENDCCWSDIAPDGRKDQSWCSKRNHRTAVGDKSCPGNKEAKVTPCSAESCCTAADSQPASVRATGASYDIGRPGLGDSSNHTRCDTSCSGSGTDVSSFEKHGQMAMDDLELKNSFPVSQHFVLDVQGLTCAGCETKLFRCLCSIPGIRNLHTSLLLSQAEFELDEKVGPSVLEVIKLVERSTGFACVQRLANKGQEIDIIVNGNAKAYVERVCPDGVIQMDAIDKQIVRVTYDARIIGARAVLRELSEEPCKLAAPRSPECESGKKHFRNTAWRTLLSAILTTPVLVLAWAQLPPRPIAYGACSLVLATIVQLAIAGPFYPSALRSLFFSHVIEMDLLIVLSTSTAYVFSLVSFVYLVVGHPLPTGDFFETSTLLVTFIMLGRLVSAFARREAVKSVSFRSLQAERAVLCDADGHGDREIDARLLQYGDFFKVMPDSYIVTDGLVTLVSGSTQVDESMITGESRPVEKSTGSSVIAGSLNGSGVMVVRLMRLPSHNTITTIAAMVDEAKFSKAKTQEVVDIVASYFVPVILTITIVTLGIWVAIGISVRHESTGRAVVNAITYGISVLIVSCPCAIGLAVPMVVVISGGVATKHGVILKSAIAIEIARKVSHVVFDKTGTLTRGELSVAEEAFLSEDRHLVASVALGLTLNSRHPVSVAISAYLRGKGVEVAEIGNYKSVTGKGVEGTFSGVNVRCGNTGWLSADLHPDVQALLAKDLSVFGVTMNDQLLALFGLSDSLRPESHSVITNLRKRNIAVSIVSGDDAGAVEAVAADLGISTSHVRSRCTPESKQEYLKYLMTDEKKVVIFCGDGSNDAIALATASVGVHMNNGSDVAKTAADVVLMRPYLGGILVLLDLSKAAVCRMFLNFAWSFLYNVLAILLAAGAFVNVRISPQYAGLGEIVSVLPVILIALQLRQFKREY